MDKQITHNDGKDGIDRRGMLSCMAWVGTGLLWTMSGGVLLVPRVRRRNRRQREDHGSFSFVQISKWQPHWLQQA